MKLTEVLQDKFKRMIYEELKPKLHYASRNNWAVQNGRRYGAVDADLVVLAAQRETVKKFLSENPQGAEDLRDLVGKLEAPRLI